MLRLFSRIRSYVSEDNLSKIKVGGISYCQAADCMNIIYYSVYDGEVTSRMPGHINITTLIRVDMPQISHIINPS